MKHEVSAGRLFGNLLVVRMNPSVRLPSGMKRMVFCRCSCGRESSVQLSNLIAGNTKSCGKCPAANSPRSIAAARRRKPGNETNLQQLFRRYQIGAAKRGFAFELTKTEFRQFLVMPCAYCGAAPANKYELRHANGPSKGLPRCGEAVIYNGIDRRDCSKGYVAGNCLPCCRVCNRAKSNLTIQQFALWVKQISTKVEDWNYGTPA